MKICVYAISRNESKFADRWADSMSEADGTFVVDTGSSDGTPDLLRKSGAAVLEKRYDPWRFDVPRNDSMAMCPDDTDVFVCTDLDEVFEKGWRKKVEDAWKPGTTVMRYDYVWSFRPDGSPERKFRYEKIHGPGYEWYLPVHELLRRKDGRPNSYSDCDALLEHHADASKSRSSYLPLLRLAVRENPDDPRMAHYLARELTFHGLWEESVRAHLAFLGMKYGWSAERAASMRYLGRATRHLGKSDEAELWYRRGIDEDTGYRESAYELAGWAYEKGDWKTLRFAAEAALRVRCPAGTYVTEMSSWDWRAYDWLGLALWHSGDRDGARKAYANAVSLFPGNSHLADNLARCG